MTDRRQLKLIAEPLSAEMLRAAVPVVAREIRLEQEWAERHLWIKHIHKLPPETKIPDLFGVMNKIITKASGIYKAVPIPKKTRGYRWLDIPGWELMFVQRCVHHHYLSRLYLPTRICHSFVGGRYDQAREHGSRWLTGRSTVSNAFAHLGVPADVEPDPKSKTIKWRKPHAIFAVDLEDAYPSVKAERVFQIYEALAGDPWTPQVLTVLSTLNGSIPQGAPTSPLLLNFACWGLDLELEHEFNTGPYRITRYVDDITLSTTYRGISRQMQERLVRAIERHGWRVNRSKDCYLHERRHALRVTGINLDPDSDYGSVSLARPVLERFRLLLYHSARILKGAKMDVLLAEEVDKEAARLRLRPVERQAVGRIRGILGFCHMVYGDNALWLPRRLFCKSLPSLEALMVTIKQNPPIGDIRDAMGEAWHS